LQRFWYKRPAVFEYLRTLFLGVRLPSDLSTRIPRSARKAAAPHAQAVQEIIHKIAALPEINEVARTKQMPKGFYALAADLTRAFDAYIAALRQAMALEDAARPGTPQGEAACTCAPTTITAIEALNILRRIRAWPDFPTLAQELLRQAQLLMQDMQAQLKPKQDPARPGLKTAQAGRMAFASRGEVCPFLDRTNKKCRIWEQRPFSCRMQHIQGNVERVDPRHPEHKLVQLKNLRLPMAQQLSLVNHVDRRMNLELSPLLFAGLLQILEKGQAQALGMPEEGETPPRLAPDGTFVPAANRNVKHAKKFQK
jgi:Fe-S-cluster containining protein